MRSFGGSPGSGFSAMPALGWMSIRTHVGPQAAAIGTIGTIGVQLLLPSEAPRLKSAILLVSHW